ncbi:uncharacterized protein L3040_000029 [Drepanopeziza brunnea f. sp. 'multigermtubi']|uniref:uncharacterized protein n=1 Tax=Drepanopeziza brunnea f. sp. 'multigermtubi' TaxID=698441 RepID=UPI002392A6BD|nr:hypothetical protein L3040_000029 [Drepanopeziza brunnea f. sp. 'multigermtubi']
MSEVEPQDSGVHNHIKVQRYGSRNQGLVALVEIPRSKQIMAEEPMLRFTKMFPSFIITEQETAEALKYHSPKEQKQFDRLYDTFGDESMLMARTLRGRLHTNILLRRARPSQFKIRTFLKDLVFRNPLLVLLKVRSPES